MMVPTRGKVLGGGVAWMQATVVVVGVVAVAGLVAGSGGGSFLAWKSLSHRASISGVVGSYSLFNSASISESTSFSIAN